uniref:Uncharacterized protein n=1 Tax=viral metagenome TaxID=1070528 RepID=A0A6M3J3M8_9ZZZZ
MVAKNSIQKLTEYLFPEKISKFRNLMESMAEYVLSVVMGLLVAVGIHELVHLKMLQFFGGNGYISIDIWGNGWMTFTQYPAEAWMLTVTALAGGVGVALIYALKMFMDLKDDYEEAYALIPLIVNQLAYGIFEGFFIFNMPKEQFDSIAMDIAVITFIAGFLASILLFARKWVNIHYPKTPQ